MWWKLFLNSPRPSLSLHRQAERRRRPKSNKLRLETLEDRAVPATFTVSTTLDELTPGDGKLSLREAITRANAHPGADTIIVPAGVYNMSLAGATEDANATGDFDVTDSVTIQGAGAGVTIIDGQQLDRVFDVFGTAPSSIRVVFQSVTIRNGKAPPTSALDGGGGILVTDADLVVRDSAISANQTPGPGGGISNAFTPGTGNVKLVDTTVARNVAGGFGGGIDVEGSSVLKLVGSTVRSNSTASGGGGIQATNMTLTDSTVSGNSASIGAGGIGGGTATLVRSVVKGNSTTGFGGGMNVTTAVLSSSKVAGNSAGAGAGGGGIDADKATLTDCTVRGNSAGLAGGGGLNVTELTLTRTTVSGNTATAGGGISAGTANLTDCTVVGNSAGSSIGGGIFAGTATLLNDTIAENTAHTGGGLAAASGGMFTVKNSIVALNSTDASGTDPDVSGDFVSGGHNLIGDGTGSTGFTSGVGGDMAGTTASPINPKLGALANNGGPTMTLALLPGSLAIDHGNNAAVPGSDQRGSGFLRIKDGNGDGVPTVDIGAFEL
jgi:predicted outer membrane repeat protein